MHRTPLIVAAALAALCTAATARADEPRVTLFSYFVGNGETGVYLLASEDGRRFTRLNDGRPVFRPPSWDDSQRLTRDPSIVYHEGVFHMVWTSNWSGRVFGYARSHDLRHWSDPRRVRPFPRALPDRQQPRNVWAPEVHHDPVRDDFFIVFSSTVPAELEDGDHSGDPHGNDHRMYVVRTRDFETFSDAQVFYDPGYSSIDGALAWDDRGTDDASDDRWVMVFKNELGPERGGKTLLRVFRDPHTGAFSEASGAIVGPGSPLQHDWAEGPSLIRRPGGWDLYWDAYGSGYYGLTHSPDLEHWTDHTDRIDMGIRHPRHGTAFRAPASAVSWLRHE